MDQSVILHLTTVLSVLTFKIAALIVGYLIVKLGYILLRKGITGGFSFKGNFQGFSADLVSASPGLLFLLLGVVLLSIAVIKDKPFSTKVSLGSEGSLSVTSAPSTRPSLDLPASERPKL